MRHLIFSTIVCGPLLLLSACSGGSGPLDTSRSTLSASPNSGLTADDVDDATITVTLLDSDGKPISGKKVTLEATGEGVTLTQPTKATNGDGQTTGRITSDIEGVKTITALLNAGKKDETALEHKINVNFGDLFGTPQDFGVAQDPVDLAIGDFDGDSIPDVVAANSAVAKVTVLLTIQLGDFVTTFTQTAYGVGGTPRSVAVGDFDGDEIDDIAAANSADDTVSILLNNGTGAFPLPSGETEYPTKATADTPQYIVAADFNGDGIVDLATANGGTANNVSVLLGNGNGTFDGKHDFAVGTNPVHLLAVDLDGDGDLDLVTTNQGSDNISILKGNGSGSFSSASNVATGTAPERAAAGLVDDDDVPDLLIGNGGNVYASLRIGDGDATFGSEVQATFGQTQVAVGINDLNNDGRNDVVAASIDSDDIHVLLGDGTGTFGSVLNFPAATTYEPDGLVVADFTGDGILDVLVCQGGSDDLTLYSVPSE